MFQKAELSTKRAKSPRCDRFANVVAARVAAVVALSQAPVKALRATVTPIPMMMTTTSAMRTMSTTMPMAKPVIPTPTPTRKTRPLLQRPRCNVSKTHRDKSQPVSSPVASLVHRSSRVSLALLSSPQTPTQTQNCQNARPRASPAPRPPRLLSFGAHRLAIPARPLARRPPLPSLLSKLPHQAPAPRRSVGARPRPRSPRQPATAHRVARARAAPNSMPIYSRSGVAASAMAVRSDVI